MSKVLESLILFGVLPAAVLAGELSSYRDFQLGSDLATVAKQIGKSPADAKAIHLRPALVQELEWRPQPLGWSAKSEAVHDAIFTFYKGQLLRIEVNYDAREIEGLTAPDVIEAISATFGTAVETPALPPAAEKRYGEREEVIARWQDSQYRFDLMRTGDDFKLVGVLKTLEGPAQTAILEAARLDKQDAPQVEAARVATEDEAAKARLAKARLVNKPKFRP